MKFDPKYSINDEILMAISEIERLRSQIDSSHILPEREIELRHRATVEATHSSTAIEGNPLNIKQVEKVLADGALLTRHQYAEIEVHNYKKALDFVERRKTSGNAIEIRDILVIHGIIMDGLLPPEKAGSLRTVGVHIVNQDDNEIYVGPSPDIAKSELVMLLKWLKDTKLHPIVAAAMLHLQFVSIHPFADGNGRSARVLTYLFLGLSEYDFRGAIVLDSFYLVDKRAYYNALHLAQGDNYKSAQKASADPWLKYFIDGFLSSAKILSIEVTIISSAVGTGSLKRMSRDKADLLNYAKQFGEITLSDAESIVPDVSKRTIQRKLKNLVDSGYLISSGKARNTIYRWNGS